MWFSHTEVPLRHLASEIATLGQVSEESQATAVSRPEAGETDALRNRAPINDAAAENRLNTEQANSSQPEEQQSLPASGEARPAAASPDARLATQAVGQQQRRSADSVAARDSFEGPQEATDPSASAAANVPNGAWTSAPAVKDREPQVMPTVGAHESDDGQKENCNGVDANQPPAVAERDRQVFEMSRRAKAEALASPPQPGLLSQALAYIMAKVNKLLDICCASYNCKSYLKVKSK